MAKFTFILTIFLITFSFASISISISISTAEQQNDLIDETSTTVGFSEILPENVETKTSDVPEMPLDRPMKIIRLHPINRHFPLHRCRHGGTRVKPMRHRQVLFGDDVMVPSGENGDFNQMVHVVRQEEPDEWIEIHRHHPRHRGMPRFPMGKHHDFFADKRPGEEREEAFPRERQDRGFVEDRNEEREEEEDGGFMRSVRKFILNSRF